MLDYDAVINWRFDDVVQTYQRRDAILYALGLGYGRDPTDTGDLRYTYEKDLVAAPTMPVVLGNQGPWMQDPRTGIDWIKSLHGEQGLKIFAPLPPEGTIVGKNRVTGVIDKGPGKGALLMMERDIIDQQSGRLLATRTSTSFLRNDGGCGAPAGRAPDPAIMPDRSPDAVHVIETRPEAALIYRLSGDYNPIHVDPAASAKAGFARPILHGLCTFGMIGRALVAAACDGEPARLKEMAGRFSAPLYPGETIMVEVWRGPANSIFFQARLKERDVVVFKNGTGHIA